MKKKKKASYNKLRTEEYRTSVFPFAVTEGRQLDFKIKA